MTFIISKSKLHCCLAILMLLIVVLYSVPLLLIYSGNDHFEEAYLRLEKDVVVKCPFDNKTADANSYSVQCPEGTMACISCPGMCIELALKCDRFVDCPDGSDEKDCPNNSQLVDTTGYYGILMKKLYDAKQMQENNSATDTKNAELDNYGKLVRTCNLTATDVVMCNYNELTRIPNNLRSSVNKIIMEVNSIESLVDINWPRNLTSLDLRANLIGQLGPATFSWAPNLKQMDLSKNNISHLDDDAFEHLQNLSSLSISSNKLTTFRTQALRHSPQLLMLNLEANQIELPPETRFSVCPKLQDLMLDYNCIEHIERGWFTQMGQVKGIWLSHNKIKSIATGSFEGNYAMLDLDLSYNQITVIDRRIFAHRLGIQNLKLSGNPLSGLPGDAFRELPELVSLNLQAIKVNSTFIKREMFTYLRLKFIYFDNFRYCHYAPEVRVCRPVTDGLSSIEELLAFPILKYAVWIVALVCSLGNLSVVIWRSLSAEEDDVLSLFIVNLSIADLMMGIYLGAIGWQDMEFKRKYRTKANEWMSSWQCTAIGFLAILSSELSVSLMTLITIERYRSTMAKWRIELAVQKRRARIYVLLAWLFSFLVASYWLIHWLGHNSDSDYYVANGLCLPLHIDKPLTDGWLYSALVYLGINFFAVIIIVVLYARMYMMILNSHKSSRPSATSRAEMCEDTILAIRFFLIVVTDCASWIPIVVTKLMALMVNIKPPIYGWLVVFIIPINSALNPIVYTLAAPTFVNSAAGQMVGRVLFALNRLASKCSSCTLTTCGRKQNRNRRTQRRQTGSNSTSTCETFDTSITCNSNSFESTLLVHQDQRTSASCSEPEPELELVNNWSSEDTRLQQRLLNFTNCTATKPRSANKSSLGSLASGNGQLDRLRNSIEQNEQLNNMELVIEGFHCELVQASEWTDRAKLSASRPFNCITSSEKRAQFRNRVGPNSVDEFGQASGRACLSGNSSNQANGRPGKRLSFGNCTIGQQECQVGFRPNGRGPASKRSLGQLDEITAPDDKNALERTATETESGTGTETGLQSGPPVNCRPDSFGSIDGSHQAAALDSSCFLDSRLANNGRRHQATVCAHFNEHNALGGSLVTGEAQTTGEVAFSGSHAGTVRDNARQLTSDNCNQSVQRHAIVSDRAPRGPRASIVTFQSEVNWPI